MNRRDKDENDNKKKPNGNWNGDNAHRSMLEREQEEKLEQLASITVLIKETVNDISLKIDESRNTVDELDTGMSNATNLLHGNMLRIKNLMATGSSSHMLYLIFFIVVVFVVVYWIFVRK